MKKKINLFRGSEKNTRFIKYAEKYKLKNIIRLTDCPLIDPQLIIKYFKLHIKKYDYSGNCFPYENRTYPLAVILNFQNIF